MYGRDRHPSSFFFTLVGPTKRVTTTGPLEFFLERDEQGF
jgi:hypothetical protein